MIKLEYKENFMNQDGKYCYEVNFADNKYIMRYQNSDIVKCLEVKTKLNDRIRKFTDRKINELKTSDLGFEYIEK